MRALLQLDMQDSLAVPIRRRRGSPDSGIIIRATQHFGKQGRERYVLILCEVTILRRVNTLLLELSV